ncbi:MAG: histidine kinase dimerization/phospho-acceptor domain-containing protein, partial [Ferruginibacter sp.]
MPEKNKKIKFAFVIYWALLAYIIAALIWWFIALTRQNVKMSNFRQQEIQKNDTAFLQKKLQIRQSENRKTAQYIGEGITFFLLIATGAIFVFRTIKKELWLSKSQHNFMLAITHELKTPIAISKLNLETIQKHKLTETQQNKLLQNTLQETNRLDMLCNNLLVSYQIDAGGYKSEKEIFNYSTLIKDCANAFATRFPQREIYINIEENIN